MTARLNYSKAAPGSVQAMYKLQTFVEDSGLEPSLLELVKTRVSQINGCAF
jgi:alkylhydroperoxidase family enzyme